MGSLTRAVVLDLGETLIDETRAWERVSGQIGVPLFTFMATFGGLIARGEHHTRVFEVLGTPSAVPKFDSTDFYPDALPCLSRLHAAGLLVGVVGNTGRSPRLEE